MNTAFKLTIIYICIGLCSCADKPLQKITEDLIKSDKVAVAGDVLFQQHCANCHNNPGVRAPSINILKSMNQKMLLATISTGSMQKQAAALSVIEKKQLVNFLAQDVDSHGWEEGMKCSSPDIAIGSARSTVPSVANWGYGNSNRRYQSPEIAMLGAKDLPHLELLWAQGFPSTTSMRSQPVLSEDTLYLAVSHLQTVYAFDLESGCIKWRYRTQAAPRSALGMAVMPHTNTPIIYFGDSRGSVHVINAKDGSVIWRQRAKLDTLSMITGAPVLFKDRLFVPLSNGEVGAAGNDMYQCCKQHGGVRALSIETGEVIWTYHATDFAKKTQKSRVGTQQWGPSGAPVWTTPAIDEKRNVLYIGTGENYSKPATNTSDAIVALNIDTGEPVWTFQATANDVYSMACKKWIGGKNGANCPDDSGPDFDFGASVIIVQDKNGKDLLLAGQKSGDVWALDPDNKGAVVWRTNLSDGTPNGGIHWGMTVVGDRVFVPVADPEWPIIGWKYNPKPGVSALDITTGKVIWQHRVTRGCEMRASDFDSVTGRNKSPWPSCHFLYGFSGAATGLDDVIFAGALNGDLSALSPNDGSLLWKYNTNRSFKTINDVYGHGGALDNTGPVIGNGYMVLQSGYSYINQLPGNVVLVFKVNKDENK